MNKLLKEQTLDLELWSKFLTRKKLISLKGPFDLQGGVAYCKEVKIWCLYDKLHVIVLSKKNI